MSAMRAKVKVSSVKPYGYPNQITQEEVTFNAVSKSDGYPSDGSDENNTFAKFSPSATFTINIANPALIGKFENGKEYYVDFTPVAPKTE